MAYPFYKISMRKTVLTHQTRTVETYISYISPLFYKIVKFVLNLRVPQCDSLNT